MVRQMMVCVATCTVHQILDIDLESFEQVVASDYTSHKITEEALQAIKANTVEPYLTTYMEAPSPCLENTEAGTRVALANAWTPYR